MSKLISVIIPVYNAEAYLSTCIDSVLSQSYSNLEILLVNDGSTDNSSDICETYAKKDNRIRVLHKQNGGSSSARNLGLDVASGDFVTFIDSDDVVSPQLLQQLFDILGNNKISMCSYQRFINHPTSNIKLGQQRWEDAPTILRKMFQDNKYIVIWGKLYRRELFNTFRFCEGIIYEDEDALPQLIHAAGGIVTLDCPLYFYRVRPNSIMTSTFSEKRLDIIGVCQRRIDMLEQWGLDNLRRTAVKDYYIHLKNLEKQTAQLGLEKQHAIVLQLLEKWKCYGVKLNLLEKLRLSK